MTLGLVQPSGLPEGRGRAFSMRRAALNGDATMTDLEKDARYRMGDKVRISSGTRLVGTVTEVRSSHSRGGRILYRVRVPMSPEPLMLEVREDEVEKA